MTQHIAVLAPAYLVEDAKRKYPDAFIFLPYSHLTGRRFHEIILMWVPQFPEERKWFDEVVRTRLTAGAKLVYGL